MSWVTSMRVVAAAALSSNSRLHDSLTGIVVEIARRLVCEQQRRFCHEGSGNGNSLLLAARQLARVVVQSTLEADLFQCLARPSLPHGPRR